MQGSNAPDGAFTTEQTGQTGGPPPPWVAPPRETLAGFWRRFGGMIIDGIVVTVVAGLVAMLVGFEVVWAPGDTGWESSVGGPPGFRFLVGLAYFTYFHSTTAGQTIGNRTLGIRVLSATTGSSLPLDRAALRMLVSIVSGIPFALGYFWMLWDRRKQTWHDKVANSLVVSADAYPPGEFGRRAR